MIYGKRIPRGNARFKAVSQPLPSIQRERRHLFLYVNTAGVRFQARPGSKVAQLAEPAQRQPNFGSLQLVSADEVLHAHLFETGALERSSHHCVVVLLTITSATQP